MRTSVIAGAILALVMGASQPAAAETIEFDYAGGGCAGGTGSGTCIGLDSFDWLQGNSILIITGETSGTILYQANLNSGESSINADFDNGDGGNYFTAVAEFTVSFNETGTFTVDPGGEFSIYHDGEEGNDLAGTGFNDGTLALSGTATFGTGVFVFQPPDDPLLALDLFNANNYPGYFTLRGTGSADIDILITDVNASFFPDLVEGSSMAFTNTSLIDPYRQIDPAAVFFNGEGGVTSICDFDPVATGTPCINGTTGRIMAQADANSSFTNDDVPIPEPASLILLGSGLLGGAYARRRQARNAKK